MIVGTFKIVKLFEIVPNDWNPKQSYKENQFNREKYEKLKATIKKKGFDEPIKCRLLDDGKYQVVDGMHRYSIAKELGMDNIPILDLGKMSREEAIGKTFDYIKLHIPEDESMVAKLVKEMVDAGIKWEAYLPFSQEEVNEYIELAKFDWELYKEGYEVQIEETDQKKEELKVNDMMLNEIKSIVKKYENENKNKTLLMKKIDVILMTKEQHEKVIDVLNKIMDNEKIDTKGKALEVLAEKYGT